CRSSRSNASSWACTSTANRRAACPWSRTVASWVVSRPPRGPPPSAPRSPWDGSVAPTARSRPRSGRGLRPPGSSPPPSTTPRERASVTDTVGVVTASAASDALDALVLPGRATACRLADDELMLLCDPEAADEVARETGTRLTVLDPDALVVEATDGWAVAVLDRKDGEVVFARL